MNPDKRGNPPFEPSSYAAGLVRRVVRHNEWRKAALANAEDMMSDDPLTRAAAEGWWRAQLNPGEVTLSTPSEESS
jgi:hypothetical protein